MKPTPPDNFLAIAAQARQKLLAAKMPEWRRAWMELPAPFRETLYRNAGLSPAFAGEPLKDLSGSDLTKLIVAAGRYADYCRKAEAWLLKERAVKEARE